MSVIPAKRSMNPGIRMAHVATLFILSSGLMNHVIVLPLLLGTTGRDGWLPPIVTTIALTLLLVPLLNWIMKNTATEPLPLWLGRHCGRWSARWFKALTLSIALPIGAVTFIDTIAWVKTVILPETPSWFLAALLLSVCAWAASGRFELLVRASILLLPPVVLMGFFVGTANVPHKSYARLLPVLENGIWPIVHGLPCTLGSLLEIVMVLFVQEHIRQTKHGGRLIVLLWVLCGLCVGPLMGAIAEFGPAESANQRYPAFEQWSLVRIGEYLEHVDFLSVFQWMSGAFIRLAFSLYLDRNRCRQGKRR